ncbi:aminoglycoside phosphotransferase family protein [Pedobacter yulinensis]|uniref:Aminoglycoside phosphotransferase family protein n=1 Tax=Pedobacter yulinensis TaxID=2126353 RepID=A0A2T3HS86_9SPHI|nr:aminoglycoside phosphotransferase family protein [Pedobacter yulinensis]PST85273.1 aminoglycoside phosphotransferase family protein [Pedobacter yulinensis]
MQDIIRQFGFSPERFRIRKFGSGLINHTWKVYNDEEAYILQRINDKVFKYPHRISANIRKIDHYLKANYPSYLFVSPLQLADGSSLVQTADKGYFRVFPFVAQSVTINTVENETEAFEAACQFGRFTRLLADFPITELALTLSDFHNLELRAQQFRQAREHADSERLLKAASWIDQALRYEDISDAYTEIVRNKLLPQRVIHHDTKISNVLFDPHQKGLCVIDLDTVMPGYFISDVGDMMRTYLSPANEEEKDFSRISVRGDYFRAIVSGYLSEMGEVLTLAEKERFVYGGKFMIYMQAIRFLTDYLNGDSYYGAAYPDHNLVRAGNQFTLLERYLEQEETFEQLVDTLYAANIQHE